MLSYGYPPTGYSDGIVEYFEGVVINPDGSTVNSLIAAVEVEPRPLVDDFGAQPDVGIGHLIAFTSTVSDGDAPYSYEIYQCDSFGTDCNTLVYANTISTSGHTSGANVLAQSSPGIEYFEETVTDSYDPSDVVSNDIAVSVVLPYRKGV
jgi:hypothetical protein